uniref:sulfurtransferase TusA family protein n=1 Tax=Pararhizobium sp. IMCC3301 TaxID=3067904 RepID=UPI0027408304|nr:sulfurtransferase TusA family protein [Pararhizobium sp. IMCC3301]
MTFDPLDHSSNRAVETDAKATLLDVSGLQCPLPVLKTQKALRGLDSGAVLRVISTDPMAKIDIPHFCSEHGHKLLLQEPHGAATAYLVEKGVKKTVI